MSSDPRESDGIAIVGLSGRFPGAANVDVFWENLVRGRDTVMHFSEEETEFSVGTPEAKARGEIFVRARGVLEGADLFDAEFFGIQPREAEVMDPQHRVFLECAWEAFENAGYDPGAYGGLAGVYAGLSLNTYLLYNLGRGTNLPAKLAGNYQVGEYATMLGNDKDFLPTRVAYKLNLRGPSMAIQCACSTSLVAVAQACTALQTYQCDMALAGGVSITFPQKRDYRYETDGMVSPDGVCRAFDAEARGTIFGHGAAVVLLKRLADARADGDTVHAIIRGCAVNNDGSEKIGYAAPGVNAQAEVIAMAQAAAGVTPDSISYVEAHGTGTPLGDPIEVAALTKAFREGGATASGFCALGTAKTHIGHLDVAAGATGLIKTVLQLRHELIPPLLHFQSPNPHIDFANSPFRPVAQATAWPRGSEPRRAGVSAFGVGGTNAHVIIEEAPDEPPASAAAKEQILVLSARSSAALNVACANLADHLEAHPELNLADVAFTLAKGRRHFGWRRALVVSDLAQAITALRQTDASVPGSPLAELWLEGGTPDWDAHFAGEARRRVPLPTYPFERKRFWIEPAQISEEPAEATEETAEVPVKSFPDRRAELTYSLRRLIEGLSGNPLADEEAKFSELGFDSLFLTQVSQAVFSQFGVKVTFRQLLGEIPSLAKLSVYLDEKLPRDVPVARTERRAAKESASRLPVVRWPENIQDGPLERWANVAAMSSSPTVGTRSLQNAALRFGPYKPIERGSDGNLTDRQRKALDDLIGRYVRRTAASKRYAEEHRPHYADPRAVSGFQPLWKEMVYPIVSSRSKGATIWDIDGNAYVDITMGFGTYFFGHSPDWLTEAVQRQLQQGIEIGPQSAMAGGIARDLCAFTGMERATFCNTGSEAVMAAIRLARTVTGRNRVVYFTGDYHGMFDEVLVRGSWVNGEYRAQPIAPGIPPSLVENMLVLDYAAPESFEILRVHADELAAVLVEPVQSRHPSLQPKAFLRELRTLTERSGAALIFDEVVTGFRCHPGGAQKYFGVQADMATYGKIVGGGLPIGVLAGKRAFMDALDGGAWQYGDDSFPEVGMTFFAGTFVRHPLVMAAARAVLDHLRDQGPGLQLRMTERTALLCRTLNAHFEAAGAPIRLPCFSAFSMIEHAPDLRHAGLLWYYLREKGIHVWENRPVFLTLAHADEDFDAIIRAFQDSVGEMQEAGFLPPAPAGLDRLGLPREFPRVDSAPTIEAQREIWASAQMGDDANRAYNESNAIEFLGPLDRPALEKALLHVVQRHPALRSTFSEDGETQFFHPAPDRVDLPVDDFTPLPEAEKAARVAALRADGTGIPFDLERGPLLRLRLIVLGAEHHLLLITAHHMICDGWSFGMIVDELSRSYSAFRDGRVPMLPPPLAFGDYARELRGEEGKDDSAREYWVGQFQTGAPVLELPADRPRPPLKSYAGAMETRVMDPDRFARLKKAAPKLGGTLFVNLLSVFATLLHRLSGQDDLVVGVPSAGQTLAGCDELVGHCLNFLPLRLGCAGDPSFQNFTEAVRQSVLSAYEHQGYTFGSLVRQLKLPRDTSRLPLVSVMFNIDKSGFDHLRFDGLEFRVLTNAKQFVNFDLFFNLVQGEDRLEVECEYNTDLYDAATIRRWLAAFEELVESALAAAGQPLSVLPLLPAEEKRQLLETWNATAREYPKDRAVQALVAEVARSHPEKTAVRCGEQSLAYAELDFQANRLAAHLQSLGVRSGDLVGLCVERSVEMVVGLLGILKSGAAYVPMDPAFPPDRLKFMVEDAHMPVLVTQRALVPRLPVRYARIVELETEFSAPPAGFRPAEQGGEHPAYVIFTSGSTGRPKGVCIPHRALSNFLNSMRREPGLVESDTLYAVTTLSFDISGLEIFLPLTAGATVIVAAGPVLADGDLLRGDMEKLRPTVMQATPATWQLLLEAGWEGDPGLKILIGGEAVPRELVNRLVSRCASLWNVYGPTETTIWSATTRLEAGEGPVPIGRPIDNTQIYIVNPSRQIQPVGVPGELLIGGDGLALGYHERPELTAERFIPGPFASGSRLYRTGDLARWRPAGLLECLGRLDDQVKVRGHRIELGEVEFALEQHPAIRQAAVVVRDDARGHKRLVAYVVADGGIPPALREDLAERLPEYMVPSMIVPLGQLPLTPNGKVDRRSLPAPEAADATDGREFVAPQSKTELMLAEIWRQVLGRERIGVHDDIFELGGDSILIFQLTARANRAGLKLSPAEIFQHRTISRLARKAGDFSTPSTIQRLDRNAYRRGT